MGARLLTLGAIAGIVTLALAGCEAERSVEEPVVETTTSAPSLASEPEMFDVAGVVRSITPARDYIVVRHGEILGFMDAMTMPFPIADPEMIDPLSPGDSVHFVIAVLEYDVSVTSLEIIPSQ